VLLTRCDAILHSKVSRSLPYADKIREEIQSDFTLLLARDAAGPTVDALDFYECRFNKAFRTLRLGRVDRTLLEVNRAVELPEEADQVEIDTDAISGRGFFSPVAASFHEAATPEKAAYREQVREALMRLPPNEAEAFILVRLLGYEEESDDPRKETAATRLNCTGRTIRNRLEKAEKKLFTILSKEHP
jgi:DNA-directed RNA polymerase specialized sigma24 family protein